jgi:hypothetical protein
MKTNDAIYTIALKNVDILQANIGRLGSYSWIVKGWTVTSWSAVFSISASPHKVTLMYSIVAVGFITAETIRVLEHLTIEKAIKLERAISMAILGQTKSLYLHGFSTNLKKVTAEDFVYVMKNEKFSMTRLLFFVLLVCTIIATKYFI